MYAELQAKTSFSFLQGASQPHELVQRAIEIGIPALALTDANGVYGLPRAFAFAKSHPDFKLISGCEIKLEDGSWVSLIARDREAYGLMCRMITAAHADKQKGQAFLTKAQLQSFLARPAAGGLVGLVSVDVEVSWLKDIFNERLYLKASLWKDGADKKRMSTLLAVAHKWEVSIIATNQVLYHVPTRHRLQDAFTCIREGVSLPTAGQRLQGNSERYLKSPFEMRLLFKDHPEFLQNTLQVAESCTFSLRELRYRYPSEWIPSQHTAQSYLQSLVLEHAKELYKTGVPAQIYHELGLIEKLGFADYFLTIYDIVKFARSKNILCQGRGSAANSAVCYCLGITAVDPVRMDMLFERFLSMERNEPPDIDVDFEHERREEVLQYVYEKYGRDRAAMVSAVVTYRSRSAFREIAKAFAVDVGTLSAKKVLRDFDSLVKDNSIPDVREQIEALAIEMEGFPRHLSIHSGGFTLSADPLCEIVPIEPARMPGRTIIQWDKYDLDELNLLKVDLLSLGMLSALRKTLDSVNLKLHELPAEDKATYEMIQRIDTVGTFQVESRAQMNMCGRLQPKTFYDLVIQVAIVRPGPIIGKMVHPYLRRRQGLEKFEFPHPKLEQCLGKTLGIPLFQEQIMRLAIEMADFTPGEADLLRRAIGAWRSQGSIETVAAKFIEGFRRRGVPDQYIDVIFEQMKGFAHYGFPESHAASFAGLTYASCYLKCHYPAEFTCALLNSQPMGFYPPHALIADVRLRGIDVLPVDPNISKYECALESHRGKIAIRMGWNLVRGLQEQAAKQIVQQAPFTGLDDFLVRTKPGLEIIENLAMAGVFESFGLNSREALWRVLSFYRVVDDQQLDLFARCPTETEVAGFKPLSTYRKIQEEYETFRASVTGHPMQPLRQMLQLRALPINAIKKKSNGAKVHVAGLVLFQQRPPTANGVTFLSLQDETGILDVTIFAREYEKYRDFLSQHCFLSLQGEVQRDGNSLCVVVKQVRPLFEMESALSVVQPRIYFG